MRQDLAFSFCVHGRQSPEMLRDCTRLTRRSEALYESPGVPEPLIQDPSMPHTYSKMAMKIGIYLEKGSSLFRKPPGSKIRSIWLMKMVRDGRRLSLSLKVFLLSKLQPYYR